MTDFPNLIDQMLGASILAPYKTGIGPNELKKRVYDLFLGHIRNKRFIIDRGWLYLVPDAIELSIIQTDRRAIGLFKESINLHNQARKANTTACLKANNDSLYQMHQSGGISVTWVESLFRRIHKPDKLEDRGYNFFQDIGVILESVFKPYLFELYFQTKIIEDPGCTAPNANSLTFGTAIDYLIENQELGQYLRPEPWKLKLSQWRNIAQHFSWIVVGEDILCKYGTNSEFEIRISERDIEELINCILGLTTALKTSFRVFQIDTIFEANELGLLHKDIRVRDELRDFNLYCVLASIGFRVLVATNLPDGKLVKIQNALLESDDPRRTELYPVARLISHFHRDSNIIVQYYSKDGVPNYQVAFDADVLRKFENREIEATVENMVKNSKSEVLT